MMKRLILVLFLVLALGIIPAALFAQQSAQHPSDTNTYSSQSKATTHSEHMSNTGKKNKSREEWQAEYKKFQEDLKAMDQRLDQKLAAMNAAQGDQKMAAMADTINEMVNQRHEFEAWSRTLHEKRMAMHQMRHHPANTGYSDTSKCAGAGCKDSSAGISSNTGTPSKGQSQW